MQPSIMFLVVAIVVLCIMYLIFDVNYFIRSVFVIFTSRYFRKRIRFLGTSEIYGMVFLSDADLFLTHMNNAKVFREFDFARFDHLQRSGMLDIIRTQNGGGVVSAQTCRYRRPLHMFMAFKVVTTIVHYDSKNIYFEHKIVTLRDDIIRCIAYVKLALFLDLEEIISTHYPETKKPKIPLDLTSWLNYIDINSEKLKTSKKDRTSGNNKKQVGDRLLNNSLDNNS